MLDIIINQKKKKINDKVDGNQEIYRTKTSVIAKMVKLNRWNLI